MPRKPESSRHPDRPGVSWDSRSRLAAGSLFDRLLIDEEGEDLVVPEHPVDAHIRSIKRNLERILNIHTGNSASAPLLGVENFNDVGISVGDVRQSMTAMIRDCILAYEPRITEANVQLQADPDDQLTLHFSIVALVNVADATEQIRFDMAMRDGRFSAHR